METLILHCAEDNLRATIEVSPAILELAPVSALRDTVMTRLKELGVQERFIWHETLDTLQELAESRLWTTPFHETIAAGIPPQNGIDGQVVFHVDVNLKVGEEHRSGKIDYKERGYVQIVEAGTLLLEVIHPTKGESGVTIFGEEIPAEHGVEVAPLFPDGRSVAVEPGQKSTLYRAKRKGWLQSKKGTLSVEIALTVEQDVGIETGNIRSVGSVTVKGSIRGGFTVETTGDVDIQGDVEAGAVIHGKNVSVSGVCHGQVFVMNNFTATIAEYTTIVAGNLVAISTAFQCEITCAAAVIDNLKACFVRASNLIQIEIIQPSTGNPSTLIIMPHVFTHRTINMYNVALAAARFDNEIVKRRCRAIESEFYNRHPHVSKEEFLVAMENDPHYSETRKAAEMEDLHIHTLRKKTLTFLEQKQGKIRVSALVRDTIINLYGQSRVIGSDLANVVFSLDPETKRIVGVVNGEADTA
ncbi:FapA family protein [Chrysiogenes arsenatis]|uniref:FapA family protein n=1 Tax=Chrysiogenes arsenatis TaxID=309797 RepID=UPI0003FFEDA6|nr:FapA family protein [Chrysiogenes arsenatis]